MLAARNLAGSLPVLSASCYGLLSVAGVPVPGSAVIGGRGPSLQFGALLQHHRVDDRELDFAESLVGSHLQWLLHRDERHPAQ